MTDPYHAIVIGGGHNGLVAGAYFAKAGARTVVVEARAKTGGAVDTSAPFPDHPEIKVSTYSYVMSLMPPFIIDELGLQRHGYRVTPFGPYYQAFPDGRSITIYSDDPARTAASVAQFSSRDAEVLPEYESWIHGVTEVVAPLLHQVPPNVGSMTIGDLLAQTRALWSMRRLGTRGVADATRLFTMSLSELLDRWFESEQMKTIMMVDGLIGQWSGPDEPGSAYVLLHHAIGSVGGASHTVNWGYPQGGMGSVADSIRDAAIANRCEIRTGARAVRILVDHGRASGVVLDTGEEVRAPIVVSCVHPQIAFLQLLDRNELPDGFVADIEHWKTRSGVVKINVAMRELPDFVADPGTQLQDHHTGSVELCLSREYAERAFQDAHLDHRAARAPFVDGAIPTTMDRELAPEGIHVFSMFSQWVPHEWSEEARRDELEAYADRAIDGYTELAPNFRDAVIDRQVIGPYDMEQDLGLIGGNIFHGELTVDQLFHMRPSPGFADYRTPIPGLYHGSSATHAGGGVSGIPGWQAFRAARADRSRRRARTRTSA
jgi:phytoene dehydrogenase-like protein